MDLTARIKQLQGPILVLGAGGFVGSNLFATILASRKDVYGTARRFSSWRLENVPDEHVIVADLLVDANLDDVLDRIKPRTVFNCVAYGAYSFETDSQLIFQTNFNFTARLLDRLVRMHIAAYVHAGSSSEYGDNSAAPVETAVPAPNSDYAVSKVACANLLAFFGRKRKLPCANLRLYSVYGPREDASRLIPAIVSHGLEGRYPELVSADVARDFVYVADACEAFVQTALALTPEHYGESFNIGSGHNTTIRELAETAGEVFDIRAEPVFSSMPNRHWDVTQWYAQVEKARTVLGWGARTLLPDGLRSTAEWYRALEDKERYHRSSKRFGLDTTYSVTAIIACYRDNLAIPLMYRRLKTVFETLQIEYEIVFVNDNSPDDSEEVIRAITREDRRVVGISHSRNFGSQACFRSGMEIATKNACVLLDGDLQDPPELIESFVAKWREGYDVVYGCRSRREASLFMGMAAKAFYRLFDYFSYVHIPRDAGDFSLLDKRVVQWILRFPERDFFLRGVRAFVGFRQIGVDYFRPKRAFGNSTNSLLANINWAKKGIFAFSNAPLNMLSFAGTLLLLLTLLLGAAQIAMRLLFPGSTPQGITTVLLAILFFGSLNLFGLAILGEYIAKIIEEVKQRPKFIRRHVITNGEVRAAGDVARPRQP